MFLSNFFFCIQNNVFFSWNEEHRYSPSCPFSSFPTLFFQTKTAKMRQNFSTCAQTTQSWQIPTKCTQMDITASHMKSRTILEIACNEMLLQLRYCIGSTEMCLFSYLLVEPPPQVNLEVNLPFLFTAFINLIDFINCYIGLPRRCDWWERVCFPKSLILQNNEFKHYLNWLGCNTVSEVFSYGFALGNDKVFSVLNRLFVSPNGFPWLLPIQLLQCDSVSLSKEEWLGGTWLFSL